MGIETVVKLLIVDDMEDIRDVLKIMFEKRGFAAETAENGQQALEMYKKAAEAKTPYAAVLSDNNMLSKNSQDGIKLLREIRDYNPEALFYLMSGKPIEQDQLGKEAKYQPTAILMKPILKDEMDALCLSIRTNIPISQPIH